MIPAPRCTYPVIEWGGRKHQCPRDAVPGRPFCQLHDHEDGKR